MKFQRMKDVCLGATVAALVMGAAPAAYAKVANMDIPVMFNNIKIVVDGKELKTDKEPFIYEGTTYLPVRAVGEAVGKNVTWDAASKTVILGETEQKEQEKEPAACTCAAILRISFLCSSKRLVRRGSLLKIFPCS